MTANSDRKVALWKPKISKWWQKKMKDFQSNFPFIFPF
jgi:hypothetical protein